VTVVVLCLVVSALLAFFGAWLMLAGRREERSELAQKLRRRPARDRTPRRPRTRPEPVPAHTRMRALSVNGSNGTAAANGNGNGKRPHVPRPEPMQVPEPSTAGAVDIRAAGHDRLEAALERARMRLAEDAEPSEA
jgi:hypothetical protein